MRPSGFPLPWFAQVVVGLALAAACGGGASSPGPPLPTSGRFTFSAQVAGSSSFNSLEGQFEVVADTVLLQVSGAYCQPMSLRLDELGYRCTAGDEQDVLRVLFKRSNPVRQPKLQAIIRTPQNTTKCSQYRVENGQRICISHTTETVYVSRTQTIYLKPQAVP